MDTKIYCAFARITDRAAMKRLMKPVPRHEQVLEQLRSGFVGRMTGYEEENRVARFFLTDGETVGWFSVIPVAADDVVLIDRELGALERFSAQVVFDAIEPVLAGAVELVH